jgi:hypothetical protein
LKKRKIQAVRRSAPNIFHAHARGENCVRPKKGLPHRLSEAITAEVERSPTALIAVDL